MTSSSSLNWVERSLKSVWHPCTQMQHHESMPLVPLTRGEGAWLFGAQGERYLDTISSWWVNLFGHANPRINAAVKAQLDQLEHAMLAGFTHKGVVELSERLSALTNQVLGHVFYASDGASAVEIALKMSFHFWKNSGRPQKSEFVCLRGGYHGETIGALAVTDVPVFKSAYEELIQGAHVLSSPADPSLLAKSKVSGDSAKAPLQSEQELGSPSAHLGLKGFEMAELAAAEFEQLLVQRAEHISAIILEPLVQCARGMAMYHPHYLERVRALCTRYQVHLIADEIAVGCARTGTFFAFEQASCWPDFVCLSKGISGGYLPLSLVMTKDDIYRAFYDTSINKAFLHSHSYTGNPLACSAALATLDIFKDDDVLQSNLALSSQITQALKPIAQEKNVHQFRNQGMIWAFDVEIDEPSLRGSFARRFFAKALEHELLVRPIGHTVYLMPPYILSDSEVSLMAERLHMVYHEVMQVNL